MGLGQRRGTFSVLRTVLTKGRPQLEGLGGRDDLGVPQAGGLLGQSSAYLPSADHRTSSVRAAIATYPICPPGALTIGENGFKDAGPSRMLITYFVYEDSGFLDSHQKTLPQ